MISIGRGLSGGADMPYITQVGPKSHPASARMRRRIHPGLVLAGAALAAAIAPAGFATRSSHLSRPAPPGGITAVSPRVVLWAWERPEILNFIDPREVGVAFLARTIVLRGQGVVVRPRLQPLGVPPGTALTAVVRIEPDPFEPPVLSPVQREKAFAATTQVSRLPTAQIQNS